MLFGVTGNSECKAVVGRCSPGEMACELGLGEQGRECAYGDGLAVGEEFEDAQPAVAAVAEPFAVACL